MRCCLKNRKWKHKCGYSAWMQATVWWWEHISKQSFDVKTAPFVPDERCEWEKNARSAHASTLRLRHQAQKKASSLISVRFGADEWRFSPRHFEYARLESYHSSKPGVTYGLMQSRLAMPLRWGIDSLSTIDCEISAASTICLTDSLQLLHTSTHSAQHFCHRWRIHIVWAVWSKVNINFIS